MTFILTIKTREGIVLAADSKEVTQGGFLMWEDYAELLKAKGQNDDSTDLCLSPNEISELIYARSRRTAGRIVGFDGVKKIHKITDNIAILVAGKANPGGMEFGEIAKIIREEIAKNAVPSYDQIADISLNILSEAFKTDADDKYDSEHIFCGYDADTDTYRAAKFFFDDRYILDGNQRPQSDGKGGILTEKFFRKAEPNQVLVSGGLTKCIRELSEFNSKNPSLSLQQGYDLSKKILDLAISIETYTEKIPAIGGFVYYAVITPSGFKWVGKDNEILNLLD